MRQYLAICEQLHNNKTLGNNVHLRFWIMFYLQFFFCLLNTMFVSLPSIYSTFHLHLSQNFSGTFFFSGTYEYHNAIICSVFGPSYQNRFKICPLVLIGNANIQHNADPGEEKNHPVLFHSVLLQLQDSCQTVMSLYFCFLCQVFQGAKGKRTLELHIYWYSVLFQQIVNYFGGIPSFINQFVSLSIYIDSLSTDVELVQNSVLSSVVLGVREFCLSHIQGMCRDQRATCRIYFSDIQQSSERQKNWSKRGFCKVFFFFSLCNI